MTRISFYYSEKAHAEAAENDASFSDNDDVYDPNRNNKGQSLAASLEVFRSTIENEDYVMGEMQQRAAQNGQLKEILFGRNEPALHHFHTNYREVLGQPLLEKL